MKTILYFKNCNSDAIAVTQVSELNENNKTLKDSYGNIYENVIREENHNANQLLKGNLAFFIEDYKVENFQPSRDPIIPDGRKFYRDSVGNLIPDPIIPDPKFPEPGFPDPSFPDPNTPGPFIPDTHVPATPDKPAFIPKPQLPNDNVELSDSVTPNRYGYIPNEIIVNHPRGWNLTKAYRDSLKVS